MGNNSNEVVIISAMRTPIGTYKGSLKKNEIRSTWIHSNKRNIKTVKI